MCHIKTHGKRDSGWQWQSWLRRWRYQLLLMNDPADTFQTQIYLVQKKTIGLRRLGCPLKSWCPVKCPIKVQLLHPFAEQPEKEAFNKSKRTKVLLFLLNCQPIVWYFYAIFLPFLAFFSHLGKSRKNENALMVPFIEALCPPPASSQLSKILKFCHFLFFYAIFPVSCSVFSMFWKALIYIPKPSNQIQLSCVSLSNLHCTWSLVMG